MINNFVNSFTFFFPMQITRQWFRYVTGIIEISSVVLLWRPNKQVFVMALLVCTMFGTVLVHYFILGPSAVRVIVLGLLSAYILYY